MSCFLTILLMSGLQIFNAHPALYWGEVSNFGDPALSIHGADGPRVAHREGSPTVAGHQFDTTGWLVASHRDATGRSARPRVSGLGDAAVVAIAGGRAALALFFAWLFVLNGLVYLLFGLLNLHPVARHGAVPARAPRHRALRMGSLAAALPDREEATRYNVIQKLVLSGLGARPPAHTGACWPGDVATPVRAASPELLTIFGGRQSARTIPLHRRVHACDLCDRARNHGVGLWRLE